MYVSALHGEFSGLVSIKHLDAILAHQLTMKGGLHEASLEKTDRGRLRKHSGGGKGNETEVQA